jgi:predicted ArsR family transcriptional regulator
VNDVREAMLQSHQVNWGDILRELFIRGPATSRMMADGFGTPQAAARKHLQRLGEAGLAEVMGLIPSRNNARQAKVWMLTNDGADLACAQLRRLEECRGLHEMSALRMEALQHEHAKKMAVEANPDLWKYKCV